MGEEKRLEDNKSRRWKNYDHQELFLTFRSRLKGGGGRESKSLIKGKYVARKKWFNGSEGKTMKVFWTFVV